MANITAKVNMLTITVTTADGQTVAVLQAPRRTFSSGREGFGSYGRIMLPNGEALQASLNLTVPGKAAK